VKSPLATILVNVSVEVPVFVSVTVFDELVVLICWRLNVRLVGERLTVVPPALAPVPLRAAVCGLPLALSVIVSVPGWLPVAVGANFTLMVHCPPAAIEAVQVLVCEYGAPAAMLVSESEAVPELVSVMVCAALVVLIVWFPKARLVGASVTAGAVTLVPVPLKVAVCGLPAALSVMVMVPVCVPVAVGAKVTLIEQFAPAASEAPQVVVSEYWALAMILEMVREAVPLFVRVMDCAALVEFTVWLANVRLVGDKLTPGEDVPVPVRFTVWGLPLALSVTVIVPVCVPVAVGVNLTLIEQFAPAASEAPQVVVSEYCELATMLLIVREAVPEFVSVMD